MRLDGIETVAVLGGRGRGADWALLCALCRCAVRLHDPDPAALGEVAAALRERVDAAAAAGALTRGERQQVLDGVIFTADLEEAATGADLLLDAGGPLADEPWAEAGAALRASAVVAAAGERSPAALAAHLPHPGRVVALRLDGAGGRLARAALVPVHAASAHALARARSLVERINLAAGHADRG